MELRVDDTRYLFDGVSPHSHWIVAGGHETHVQGNTREPLLLECETFLHTDSVDPLGAAVVGVIEAIKANLVFLEGKS